MHGPNPTDERDEEPRATQGTVAAYDATRRSGTVLLDDGVRLTFGPGTVRADVRHLRVGQRVHLDLHDDGTVTGVRIH